MIRYATSRPSLDLRSDSPLTNEQILNFAPSVFATTPHESRGDRYGFVETTKILDALRNTGFQPYEVRQTKCRDLTKRSFTRHMLRLRHPDMGTNGAGEFPELVLLNSHDGSSSYQLMLGVFRMICSNGMIAGDICNSLRVQHKGNIIDNVIEGSYTIIDEAPKMMERIEQYKSIQTSPQEQLLLANAVREVRWGDTAPVTAESLLTARRYDDRKDDLWTVANRLQENVIRGGLSGRAKSGRRMTTRSVKGVNEDVRLNKALWSITDHFATLVQ